ncbi:pappalysin-1 domain protein [Leptospira sp. WS92.C1]
MLRKSVILILMTSSLAWGCPVGIGKKDTSDDLKILLGLYAANEALYHCEPEENFRADGVAPNFSLSTSNINQILASEAGVYPDGGTAYLVGTVDFNGLGKDNPMGIVYIEQDHGLETNPNRFILPLWENSNGDLIMDNGKSETGGTRSVTTAFPIGAAPGYFAPSAGYNNFGSNRMGVDFILPSVPAPTILTHKVTNNTVQTCEEFKFRPDTNGLFGSANSGLSKVWQSRKKLNINLIFINGVVNTQSTAGMATMINELKNIYAQDTVKIDVTVTAAVVNTDAATFLAITDLNDDFGDVDGSLGDLYKSNPDNRQDVNSLNIYITKGYQISPSAPAGILGISSGIPGIPVAGTPKSGMIVFLENHRTAAGCGGDGDDLICAADQTFLAKTIAHEGAHYLGLYHPVERDVVRGQGFTDPLPETPECKDQNGNGIIGLGECLGTGFYNSGGLNLMFWAGDPSINQTQITGEQGWVLRSHPLVY